LVYTNPSVPHKFREILKERIQVFAAPVGIVDDVGGRYEDRWDKVQDFHLTEFWGTFGTRWFPEAEFQEIIKFEPQNPVWLEPDTRLGKVLELMRTIFMVRPIT
jgi:hypothetical protein